MNLEKDNEFIGKVKRYKKGIVFICVMIVIIMAAFVIGTFHSPDNRFLKDSVDFIEGEEGKVSTISKASLEKVFDISELSTADYTYNAIATAYDEDGATVKYYVAYEGKVKAGIDFGKVKYDINEEEKIIRITIPEVEFTEKTVSPGTLEYIFKDKKSETENVYQEAFELCKRDLAERTDKEEELLQLAKENTVAVIEALVIPWVEQIDDEYKVEIQ
ncbi:MAG: DUF4230 domain-containing protein [Lachnospiraceae bacterium]|nr:DUF4230 domain-containing protein [Lachnospiraceae bacterium]